jgi:hypothetical protein
MARVPVPGASGAPTGSVRTRSVFNVLNDCPQSLEELNNYSGQMTSRKYDVLEPIAGIADSYTQVGAAITGC